MQNCTPHTTHMLDIHMYRAGHAANVILAEHTGGKNLTFPQMWTAHMGQSCSSSPSVQYWSQLLLKSEQTIWITPEAEWLKALKSTLALDTQVYPAASPQTSWVSLAIQELEICSPTAADGTCISCHYTHIHTQHIYTSFPQQLSPVSCPDWQSLPLLTFKPPYLSESCFGFMVSAAASSHICLFIISLVLHKPRIFHPGEGE